MVTKRRKIRLGLGLGFGFIVAIVIAVTIVRLVEANRELRDQPKLKMQLVHTISGDDSTLFSEKCLTRLKVDFGWKDIYRQVSFMLLNSQYQLIMAQCDLKGQSKLPDLVHLRNGYGEGTVMVFYKPERLKDHGQFEFRLAPLLSVSNIILTYSGEKAEPLIANDSVLQYRFSCSNISIRYAADSPVDIFLTSGDAAAELHLDVLFVKRHGRIYFLFLTPVNYETHVDPISAGELLRE